MEDVVILGGGISALGAVYYLDNRYRCSIIEKFDLGGLAGSYSINNFQIEKYYHHLFKTDSEFIRVAGLLGCEIEWHESKSSFFHNGEFYRFSTPLDLLLFKPLKFFDRVKFGLNMLTLKSEANLDGVTAEKWLIDKWGRNTYSIMFKPLLKMKFGLSMDKVSAAFVRGRLLARSSSRKGSKELLGYVKGGFGNFFTKLEKTVRSKATVYDNTTIKSVSKDGDVFIIETDKGVIKSKKVLNTLPLDIFKKVAKFDLDNKISQIGYQGVVCVLIATRNKLTDYYWTNIIDPGMSFGVVVEHTNFLDSSNYNGEHITYLSTYCSPHDELFKISETEIIDRFLSDFKKIKPDFDNSELIWAKVSRNTHATPIFDMGFESKIPSVKTNIDGLFLAGGFLVYPDSRNMNKILETTSTVVDLINEKN